jgi:DNA polymerase-3 subunit gamma/tau
LADVRRLWPLILEAVKTKRRFAWIMLSQNAQVIAIDEQILTLGLVNAGARESFARSGSDEILREAMMDTIGLNRRVEAVVDPSTDPGSCSPAAPSSPPPSSPPASSWDSPPPGNVPTDHTPGTPAGAAPNHPADPSTPAGNTSAATPNQPSAGINQPAGAANGGVDTPGAPVGGLSHADSAANSPRAAVAVQDRPATDGNPAGEGAVRAPLQADQQAGGPPAPTAAPDLPADRREQAASKRRAAEAAVAAEQARRAAVAPIDEAPLTPEEEAEAVGEDDVVLEEDSRSHTDLLRETLGAQIITEEPN